MITLKLTPIQRTTIVAALAHYGIQYLAKEIANVPDRDPADDGPEVELLMTGRIMGRAEVLRSSAR